MLNNKDYCDYDTSITLGELGFPLKRMKVKNLTDRKFDESIVPVLLYEAQKWLREEKKIDVFVRAGYLGKNRVRHYFVEVFTSKNVITLDNDREDFDSYEEALSEGIKEAIKILISESEVTNKTSIKFTSILRLMEIIPSNVWNQDNRGRTYAEKLASILEEEGYSVDAKLVREKIKQMNGESVPLAIMD